LDDAVSKSGSGGVADKAAEKSEVPEEFDGKGETGTGATGIACQLCQAVGGAVGNPGEEKSGRAGEEVPDYGRNNETAEG
jgi:hypothetical protein